MEQMQCWPSGSRSGFFNFPSLRTVSSIAARNSHDHQSDMTTNPRTHKPRATVKTVYLLPGRIDGISPQADGDRALTRGFRPAEISPNDPPCLLIQANELLRSAAPHHARGFWTFGLQNFSAELFHECAGRRQVRKTPAIIRFAFLQSSMPVPRLDVSSIMKVHDPTP